MSEAIYNGAEMTVWFQAQSERCDYGVRGSPVWYEIDPATVEVTDLEILGVHVDFEKLPGDLQEAIRALSDECEWRGEE